MANKNKKERLMMRVIKGGLIPSDIYTSEVLRGKRYHLNDIVSVDIRKPRNIKFNRLVHRIGQLVVANIEAFDGLDPHVAIKRLQLEGRIHCDLIGIFLTGCGMVEQAIPRSLSFDTMDEAEYQEAARGICKHIAKTYWSSLTPEQVEQMAECFVGES